MATHTPGISALRLERQPGIGGYQNARHVLHRLRKGMVHDARSRLSGLVEADETFVGGPVKGKQGRVAVASNYKSLVVGAVEILAYNDTDGKRKVRAGRLRLALIPDASESSRGGFLEQNVDPGSRVRTDGGPGCSETAPADFIRHVGRIGPAQPARNRLPHIHRAFGNLKTWLKGTHHGVKPKHLQSYLDEYVFRHNRRKTSMAAFQTLLGIPAQKKPVTLHELMLPEPK